jgi:hypothetical protein
MVTITASEKQFQLEELNLLLLEQAVRAKKARIDDEHGATFERILANAAARQTVSGALYPQDAQYFAEKGKIDATRERRCAALTEWVHQSERILGLEPFALFRYENRDMAVFMLENAPAGDSLERRGALAAAYRRLDSAGEYQSI